MGFRFDMTFPDGTPMITFEEQEDLTTGSWGLVTTFCDARVSAGTWRDMLRVAQAEWRRYMRTSTF